MRPIRSTKRRGSRNYKIGLGRWRIAVMVVFFLAFSLIARLFSLQVTEAETFRARASNQHQVSSKLIPERGKIYFKERFGDSDKLYAAASVRDLATLYSIPKDVEDPLELAEKFYTFFDKKDMEDKLRKDLGAESKEASVKIATSSKKAVIDKYLLRFDKPGDPYEPLNKTIEINKLLELYAFLLNTNYEIDGEEQTGTLRSLVENREISASDLDLKNERIYLKTEEGSKPIEIPGLGFDFSKFRYYPEGEMASQILGYVSYVEGEGKGHYGLEEFFDKDLVGKYGHVKSEKGNSANSIIVNDREYVAPVSGVDLVLTIDRNIEFYACQKLKEAVDKHGATGGSVIVVKPQTGAILAMCSEPNFDPNNYKAVKDLSHFNNPSILYQYEPGSVFKVITMAAAINEKKVSPSTTFKDTGEIMINGWHKPIRNSDFSTKGAHGVVDMNYVLDNSLNTGAIYAMKETGAEVFSKYVKGFGFGEKTGIEIGAESSGDINNLLRGKIKEIDAATASFGQGIAVTPLQMLMSYQAIANEGVLMKPYLVDKIIRGDKEEEISPKELREVVSPETAGIISAMLVNIVEKGHSKRAHIDGYYVGGKTGTAQIATIGGYKKNEYIHNFIGVAPIDDPAFVMLTKIDSPKDVQYAEGSALPLWQDIADYILKYYQVPKTRK